MGEVDLAGLGERAEGGGWRCWPSPQHTTFPDPCERFSQLDLASRRTPGLILRLGSPRLDTCFATPALT